MWRDLEEDAIFIGLDLHYFWSLDVKQYLKHVRAYNKKQKQKFKDMDALNHLLGQYVGIAFNNPKKYPSKPYTQKEDDLKPMTDDEMERQARHNTIKMGGVINDS